MTDLTIVASLSCPGCGEVAGIDRDQYLGRVSVHHDECGYHEAVDWSKADDPRVVLDSGWEHLR